MKTVKCLICHADVVTEVDKDLCRTCGDMNNNGIVVEYIANLQKNLEECSLICNIELFDVEQVARNDLPDSLQSFYDIQELAYKAVRS